VRVFSRERTWIRVRVEFQFPGVDPIKGVLVAENDQEPRFQEIPPRKIVLYILPKRVPGPRPCCGTASGYAF
jgi:hypothetical protein